MCDIPDPEALVVGDGEEVLAARVEGQLGQVRSFPDFRVLLLLPRLSTLPLLQKRES